MTKSRIVKIVLVSITLVLALGSSAQAMTVSRVPEIRNGRRTGWHLYQVHVTASESRALHTVFGYNLRLGRTVIDRIFADMGAPRGFTAIAAMAPTIGWGTARVGYDLWYWSRQHRGRAFVIGYRVNLHAMAEVRRILGSIGDRLPQAHEVARIVRIVRMVMGSCVPLR